MSECIICLEDNDTIISYPNPLSTCECKYNVHILCEDKLLEKNRDKCLMCNKPFKTVENEPTTTTMSKRSICLVTWVCFLIISLLVAIIYFSHQ